MWGGPNRGGDVKSPTAQATSKEYGSTLASGHVIYVYGRAGALTATYVMCCAA